MMELLFPLQLKPFDFELMAGLYERLRVADTVAVVQEGGVDLSLMRSDLTPAAAESMIRNTFSDLSDSFQKSLAARPPHNVVSFLERAEQYVAFDRLIELRRPSSLRREMESPSERKPMVLLEDAGIRVFREPFPWCGEGVPWQTPVRQERDFACEAGAGHCDPMIDRYGVSLNELGDTLIFYCDLWNPSLWREHYFILPKAMEVYYERDFRPNSMSPFLIPSLLHLGILTLDPRWLSLAFQELAREGSRWIIRDSNRFIPLVGLIRSGLFGPFDCVRLLTQMTTILDSFDEHDIVRIRGRNDQEDWKKAKEAMDAALAAAIACFSDVGR